MLMLFVDQTQANNIYIIGSFWKHARQIYKINLFSLLLITLDFRSFQLFLL